MNPELAVKISESAFMEFVLEYANLRSWLVYHTHTSKYSRPGFPDLLLLRQERLVVAELKRVGKDPTLEQRAWLNAFSAAGAEAHLWRPGDWGEIEAVLR